MLNNKKLSSILFFCLFSFNSFAQLDISSLSIKDENLAACITAIIHKNAISKISQLTKVKCHGKNIRQLQGIEKLTSLQNLSLYNNKIKTAELSKLSQLAYLNIAGNKLTSINIANLSQLHTLYLFKNKLKHVNFTGLKNIKKLRITNNLLRHVDISPLVALEKAYFFDNKLEDLVILSLPKLSFLEVRQNPMPDEVYDRYDAMAGITIVHDGNADDWK